MPKIMPRQKPGLSAQDYRTPKPFLAAVRGYLGIKEFDCDLFADRFNTVCPQYISKYLDPIRPKNPFDAFRQSWKFGTGWNWANPEFREAERVVARAWNQRCLRHANTCILLPASVSTNWFAVNAHQKAMVIFVRPRLTFEGCEDPYPKDLMLLCYGWHVEPEYRTWKWTDK